VGSVCDKHLRCREPKTAAAAGHKVNPAAQSKIHRAILLGLVAAEYLQRLVLHHTRCWPGLLEHPRVQKVAVPYTPVACLASAPCPILTTMWRNGAEHVLDHVQVTEGKLLLARRSTKPRSA
jgi:uncharacterized membrane protein